MTMYEYPVMTEKDGYKDLDSFWKQVKAEKIFLVCDPSIVHIPIGNYFDRIQGRRGLKVVKFDDFSPNPTYDSVLKGIKAFCREDCDILVAVGGGSAIDVAKCIRVRLSKKDGFKNIKFLAIPTTAGTGSEATQFAVIYYHGEKKSIEDRMCIPSAILMDSSALLTLPDYQRKATMMDALCHAIESFWSVNSTEESKEYSGRAVKMILKYKDSYLANEAEGNKGMLYSANLAGRAINIAKTTAGHAMCYKLTSLYGIAHGHGVALCVARLWPYMILHIDKCMDKRGREYLKEVFKELADVMGGSDAYSAANKFSSMVSELGLLAPRIHGDSELELLKASVNRERLKNTPILLEDDDISNLYRQILGCG